MIAIESSKHSCRVLSAYEKIAGILAKELPCLSLGSEPLDLIDSLEELSDEMAEMPEIIKDCRLAMEAFTELNQVIDHMYALADRAVELDEICQAERKALDEDFKSYSHIVARLSGANNFNGPSLSLASRAEAMVARTILGYLNEARNGFTKKLAAQSRQINLAMDEALNLLSKIVYEAEEISYHNRGLLQAILDKLTIFTDINNAPAHKQEGNLH